MKSEVKQLRLDVEKLVGSSNDADTEIYWEAHRAAHNAFLSDPVTREAVLSWDEKYLADDSPHRIDTTGMNTEERIAAMNAAWQADNPWPGFGALVDDYVNQLKTQGFITKPPRVGELATDC
jgi:hypothetical protein